MNHLIRNQRVVYICNRIEQNGRMVFSKPKKFNLNCQPLSTEGEIIAVGEDYINRLSIKTSAKIAKQIHNFDRCYVYVDKSSQHDKYCQNADFYVNGEPLIYLNEGTINLQRMTGDEDA